MRGRLGMVVTLLFASLGVGCIGGGVSGPVAVAGGPNRTGFLLREVALADGSSRKYSVYIPESYDPNRVWPTIVFLQGLGEGGTDGTKQTTVGLGPYIRKHAATFGLIAVFPQSGGKWTSDDAERIAIACLDDVEKRYRVDKSRVYLNGVSMGGYGTWRLGAKHADRFAALVPMSAFDGTAFADRLTRMPIWAFHNSFDPIVFSSYTRKTVDRINESGGKAMVSIYGALAHDCWTRGYEEPEFWPWLLRQKKTQRSPARS